MKKRKNVMSLSKIFRSIDDDVNDNFVKFQNDIMIYILCYNIIKTFDVILVC